TNAWKKLQQRHAILQNQHLKTLFAQDSARFHNFSARFEELLVDYSKNLLDEETLQNLLELARECELPEAIEKMFTGDKINQLEKRAVLHTALRNRSNQPVYVDG